jgi:hypothetical protein
VTGALSGPYDRYLARVIWLVCFVGLLGLCNVARIRLQRCIRTVPCSRRSH